MRILVDNFANASFAPDLIATMGNALDGAISTLPHPVSSGHVQFLAEALVITLIGGIAGVVLAYLVSWLVGSMTLWSAFIENGSEGDIRLTIDSTTLFASTMILGFVGIISGMLPAIKASRLDPIEALRYE